MAEKMIIAALYLIFCTGILLILKSSFLQCNAERRFLPAVSVRKKCSTFWEKMKKDSRLQAIQKDKTNREIYEGLSYLRNLIITHKGGVNSDSVISGLAERDSVLKGTYLEMLPLLRTGKTEEAGRVMQEAAGTEVGKEYASLLVSWEQLPPEQLVQIIGSYRRNIKETCITRQKKRDMLISDFVYFPATANVFLIFINFIYISYFMEQKEMFEMIF